MFVRGLGLPDLLLEGLTGCLNFHHLSLLHDTQASLDGARAADHKLMLCHALAEAVCPITLMTGDLIGAERAVAMLIDLATSHNAALWKIWGRCLKGKLLMKRDEFAAGLLVYMPPPLARRSV